ncbi:MAG: Smr/MutS family protein [Devosiaceae bacterium]
MSARKRSGQGPGEASGQKSAHGAHINQADGEAGLWDRVKKTVDPLDAKQRALYSQALAEFLDQGGAGTAAPPTAISRQATKPHPAQSKPAAMKHHAPGHPAATVSAALQARKPRHQGQPPLVEMDRKTRSRVAKGRTPISARLDLHGLRQHEAHDVLRSFIWRSHSAGHRTVLVITGKGTRIRDPHPDAPPWAVGSGILRQAVPGWLSAPDMRAAVLGVETAHASHGGEGALYVRLRAQRSSQ